MKEERVRRALDKRNKKNNINNTSANMYDNLE